MKNSEKKIENDIKNRKVKVKHIPTELESKKLLSQIEVIFEDDDILVINKPSGVYTIPDRFNDKLPNIFSLFNKDEQKTYIVHRLDRDTSGILILAKNAETHKYLNDLFAEQKIKKIYHAVIYGSFDEDEFDIDIPIAPSSSKQGISVPSARGKASLTKIRVIERYRYASLVEANLVSGRHHQLRVHLSAVEHPLFIDEIYGSPVPFYLSTVKPNFKLKKHTEEQAIISRITMHAFSIEFIHPKSKELVKFEAKYPKDFAVFLHLLQKYSKSKY